MRGDSLRHQFDCGRFVADFRDWARKAYWTQEHGEYGSLTRACDDLDIARSSISEACSRQKSLHLGTACIMALHANLDLTAYIIDTYDHRRQQEPAREPAHAA